MLGLTRGAIRRSKNTLVNSSGKIAQFLYYQRNVSSKSNLESGTKSEFDYIIVGAGSAGCVLANKLSENQSTRVCLLESGPRDTEFRIHMPAGFGDLINLSKVNWNYTTVPQEHQHGRVDFWPRGRVWGGSSSINAMIYSRCQPEDYDRWVTEGCPGWSFKECLPIFKAMENYDSGLGQDLISTTPLMKERNKRAQQLESKFRGKDGPYKVTNGRLINHQYTQSKLMLAFVESGDEAGVPYNPDFNGEKQEGIGWYDLSIANGTRQSAARTFLYPALTRKNLVVRSKSHVSKVIIDPKKKRAIGVEIIEKGKVSKITSKEVIISAGAVNTPQILMLSGVGNSDHLRTVGIEPLHHLPAVGENLQDHVRYNICCTLKDPSLSMGNMTWTRAPHKMIKVGLNWRLFTRGIGASNALEAGGFFKALPTDKTPTMQMHLLPLKYHMDSAGALLNRAPGFMISVSNLRGTSTGTIRLESRDPLAKPIIDPRYLSTKEDIAELVASVSIVRRIVRSRPLSDLVLAETEPGPSVRNDRETEEFLRHHIHTIFHPCGTCRMGVPGRVPNSDNKLVVDSRDFHVLGLEGLRVVDGSLMPSITSANLNVPITMMAHRAAMAFQGKLIGA